MNYRQKCDIFKDKLSAEMDAPKTGPIGRNITSTAFNTACELYANTFVSVYFVRPKAVLSGTLKINGELVELHGEKGEVNLLERDNIEFIKPRPARFILTCVDVFPLEKPILFEDIDAFIFEGQLVGRWGFADEDAAREFYRVKLEEAQRVGVLVEGESITIKLYDRGRLVRKGEVSR